MRYSYVETMVMLAQSNFETLNRESGLYLSPISEMRNHVKIEEIFGFTPDMTDADVVRLLKEVANIELITTEVDGQLMAVRVAEKDDLIEYDVYHAIIDKAEVEAQAAYDKVLDETDDDVKAEEAYNKIMDKAEDEAAEKVDEALGEYYYKLENEEEAA